jgi:hypothetical protein
MYFCTVFWTAEIVNHLCMAFSPRLAHVCLVLFAAAEAWPAATATDCFTDLAAFQRDLSPAVAAALAAAPKQYRQIEPSLFHLAAAHAERITSLPGDEQVALLVKLARFIDAKRQAEGNRTVIGQGRAIIGLLDPDRGLDPKEILAVAKAYGADATIFKRDEEGETIRSVADGFLAAVSRSARGTAPTTIVVLGHGLPRQIQSYRIPVDRLAHALLPPAEAAADTPVDLGHLVLICDDCYSADFSLNLAAAIEAACRSRGLVLVSTPTLIAGTNRDCVGHADFGEKFVPHFWKDVIELFYIRRPHPPAITLRDFFEKVDNMMYGYGRAASVSADGTVSYRLVDAEQCQDPVVFVPLSPADRAALREILGLPADASLPAILDIG